MAAKGGRIDFMFLVPPYPAAEQNDRHLWKDYLPATSFTGSDNRGSVSIGDL